MLDEDAAMTVKGLEIRGEVTLNFAEILTPDALLFVANLERAFGQRRRELLQKREARQARNRCRGHA